MRITLAGLLLVSAGSLGCTGDAGRTYLSDPFNATLRITIQGSGIGTVKYAGTDNQYYPQIFDKLDCKTGGVGKCEVTKDLDPYGAGTVRLKAQADPGSEFAGWALSCFDFGTDANGHPVGAVLLDAEGIFTCQATFNVVAPPPAGCLQQPVTFSDDFSVGNLWTKHLNQIDGTASDLVSQEAAGGNPDGYRRMSHTLGPPAGTSGASYIWVVHLYTGASYDPASQGEVCQLIYQEDQIDFSAPIQVMWGVVVRQNNQDFIYRPDPQFNFASWTHKGPYTLTAEDFTPAPGPNFSVTGPPMQFGYLRANSTGPNPTTTRDNSHGIDNWRFDVVHK